jgi:hypothetical protein
MTSSPPLVSNDHLVWYAVYGSNLLKKRFCCYIAGGKPDGSNTVYSGCRDKSPPREDRQIKLTHELYFAGHSTSWNASIAFVRQNASATHTHGRMYLLSYDQFNDVVRQENGRDVPGNTVVPPFENLAHADHFNVAGFRLYGRFIKVGAQDGHLILTLTATKDNFAVGAPSEAYVKTIAAGLKETYPFMRKSEILDYLGKTEGVRDLIQPNILTSWILGG